MNSFRENYCRICLEFFCCKNCRLEHEQESHNIHPECNICVYGKTYLRLPSESLLYHFSIAHWPLHCILCKRVFTSIRELKAHSICPAIAQKRNLENSSVLIQSSPMEPNYDSPPITTTMHKSILTSNNKRLAVKDDRRLLTTSTPMQKINENQSLEQIPEIITPVDYSGKIDTFEQLKSNEASKTNIKSSTNEQMKNDEMSLKRRVTFSEIEIINYHESNELSEEHAICDVNQELNNIETEMYTTATEDTDNKLEMYTTVSEESIDAPLTENETDSTNCDKLRSYTTVSEESINASSSQGGEHVPYITDNSNIYTTTSEESVDTSIIQKDKHTCTDDNDELHLCGQDTNTTIWESAFFDINIIKAENSVSNESNVSCCLNDSGSIDSNASISRNLDKLESQSFGKGEASFSGKNQDPMETIEESLGSSKSSNSIKRDEFSKAKTLETLSAISEDLTELDNQSDKLIEVLSPVTESRKPEFVGINETQYEDSSSSYLGETLSSITDFNFKTGISCSTFNQNHFLNESVDSPKEAFSEIDINLKRQSMHLPNIKLKSTILGNLSSKIGKLSKAVSQHSIEDSASDPVSQSLHSNETTTKSGIWSSVTNALKTVVSGLSKSPYEKKWKREKYTKQNESHKRTKSDSDVSHDDSPLKKRMKFTHIQCRRTIRNIRPFYELGYGRKKVKMCDKSTQTDF